jgi:hypothetical protein
MKTIYATSWEDFLERLDFVKQQYSQLKKNSDYISPLLFRGQRDCAWLLETSLERYTKQDEMSLEDYGRVISEIKYPIESFTERSWDIIKLAEYNKWLQTGKVYKLVDSKAYNFMIYLRHHGFPSPLLDWTRSLYVAAFFAYREATPCGNDVSIYAFCERPQGNKSSYGEKPHIEGLGPKVRTHRRHHLQQSEYTICLKNNNAHMKDDDKDKWVYAPHEEAFKISADLCRGEEELEQDICWKFNIPAKERQKVLELLDEYNLNAFSLFSTEESLMETLAQRKLPVIQKLIDSK